MAGGKLTWADVENLRAAGCLDDVADIAEKYVVADERRLLNRIRRWLGKR